MSKKLVCWCVGADVSAPTHQFEPYPDHHSATAAVVLAAGSSSRMGEGRHKLLLPLAGRPVLAHVLEACCASLARPIIVVLGHQASIVRDRVEQWLHLPDIVAIDNTNYREGMSTSLRLGLQRTIEYGYKKCETIDSAIILLGDQPLITSRIIDALIQTRQATGKSIVAPVYEGKRGNPVLFAADLFSELLRVTGDEGGRSVMQRHPEQIATVEVGSDDAAYDVDTWEAYQQVVNIWQSSQ